MTPKQDNKYTDGGPKFAHTKVNLYENLSCENKYMQKIILLNFEKLMTEKFKGFKQLRSNRYSCSKQFF